MSPRKLTEDDKQEILQLYRNSEATTSTLANRYEVSSSTISRFLKNKLSTTEYEDLIQQKRLARTPRGEKTAAKKSKTTKTKATKTKKTRKKSTPKAEPVAETIENKETPEKVVAVATEEPDKIADTEPTTESQPEPKRRRRRRSSASTESDLPEVATIERVENIKEVEAEEVRVEELETPEILTEEEEKPAKLIIDKKIAKNRSNSLILKGDKPTLAPTLKDTSMDNEPIDIDDDDDDDENEVDLITLKEMLGEDLEDINDEEDDEDWDEEEDEADVVSYSRRDSSFDDIEILPLSKATFPRTCYLVIDRAAELIVKPLADFADLGEIPDEEVRQKTLPVFDNHNIAKRFSHRRDRVIKVPDGRMLQKTSRHLQDKGITRLLIDGQIYSLLN